MPTPENEAVVEELRQERITRRIERLETVVEWMQDYLLDKDRPAYEDLMRRLERV